MSVAVGVRLAADIGDGMTIAAVALSEGAGSAAARQPAGRRKAHRMMIRRIAAGSPTGGMITFARVVWKVGMVMKGTFFFISGGEASSQDGDSIPNAKSVRDAHSAARFVSRRPNAAGSEGEHRPSIQAQ
jgi:hypothetical protein